MGLEIIKVYVVTTGMYSDYSIRGIYSTEPMAKLAEKMFGSEADIEEWNLDFYPDYPRDKFYYRVHMANDGKVTRIYQEEPNLVTDEYSRLGYDLDNNPIGRIFSIWAKDKMHAIKIANEQRARLIANNEWDKENKKVAFSKPILEGGDKT